ncbi:hypothetical protein [Haloarcula sp. Atlit-47R]|uniref:hypothetical protein n=1 Tax=Haloarcula sp. Atlit-47R TaxID=2282132 RepID=UPI001314C7AF|nr:hypothetical protein [Haloarcula sp. Atlit-47R]
MGGNDVEKMLVESGIAAAIADILNLQAMDMRALGDAVDVDVPASQVTEEKAAEILVKMVQQNPALLIKKANEMQDRRNRVMRELMAKEEFERLEAAKEEYAISAYNATPYDPTEGSGDD